MYHGHWTRTARRRWIPRDTGTCFLWVEADRGVTLGTTPRASGTTPPVVTLSGSGPTIALRIEITTGGALGAALFRWSKNNGSTFEQSGQTTAASFPLGTTGYTAAFPSGTYSTNNVYLGTVATWADQSGNSNDLVQATASAQPTVSFNAFGGQWALQGDGAALYLKRTFSGTKSQPITAGVVANAVNGGYQIDGIASGNRVALASDGSKVSLYAGNAFVEGGALTGPMTNVAKANGASSTIRTSGAQINSGNAGSNTLTGLTAFSRWDQASFLQGTIAAIILDTAPDVTDLETYLRAKYATW